MVWVLLALILLGCEGSNPEGAETTPRTSAKSNQTLAAKCREGQPRAPRRELEQGHRFFSARKFAQAERHFAGLRKIYPQDAEVLAAWVEVVFFNPGEKGSVSAARVDSALEQAMNLHAAGCPVRERTLYRLHMIAALGSVRRALVDEERAGEWLQRADQEFSTLIEDFPPSAEVYFHRARAFSLRAARGEKSALSNSQRDLLQTLDLAQKMERPRFITSHQSVDDWLMRADTDSALQALRASEYYRPIAQRTLP